MSESSSSVIPARGAGTPTVWVTSELLETARAFFEERGSHGLEGTALIAAHLPVGAVGAEASDAGDANSWEALPYVVADTLVVPEQHATPVPYASVTVTDRGNMQIASALRADQRYVARIHSHPGTAFHSRTDDNNPALTHQGALSIVVPFFGLGLRRGLHACAVYVRQGTRWVEAPAGTSRRETVVGVHA